MVQLVAIGLFLFSILNNIPGVIKNFYIVWKSDRFISVDEEGVTKLHYWRETKRSRKSANDFLNFLHDMFAEELFGKKKALLVLAQKGIPFKKKENQSELWSNSDLEEFRVKPWILDNDNMTAKDVLEPYSEPNVRGREWEDVELMTFLCEMYLSGSVIHDIKSQKKNALFFENKKKGSELGSNDKHIGERGVLETNTSNEVLEHSNNQQIKKMLERLSKEYTAYSGAARRRWMLKKCFTKIMPNEKRFAGTIFCPRAEASHNDLPRSFFEVCETRSFIAEALRLMDRGNNTKKVAFSRDFAYKEELLYTILRDNCPAWPPPIDLKLWPQQIQFCDQVRLNLVRMDYLKPNKWSRPAAHEWLSKQNSLDTEVEKMHLKQALWAIIEERKKLKSEQMKHEHLKDGFQKLDEEYHAKELSLKKTLRFLMSEEKINEIEEGQNEWFSTYLLKLFRWFAAKCCLFQRYSSSPARLRKNEDLLNALFKRLGRDFGDVLNAVKVSHYCSSRMAWFRFFAFVFGVLPELASLLFMSVAGVQYILWSGFKVDSDTKGMEEIILATLAINFIYEIDDAVYDHVLPELYKEAHERDRFDITGYWISSETSAILKNCAGNEPSWWSWCCKSDVHSMGEKVSKDSEDSMRRMLKCQPIVFESESESPLASVLFCGMDAHSSKNEGDEQPQSFAQSQQLAVCNADIVFERNAGCEERNKQDMLQPMANLLVKSESIEMMQQQAKQAKISSYKDKQKEMQEREIQQLAEIEKRDPATLGPVFTEFELEQLNMLQRLGKNDEQEMLIKRVTQTLVHLNDHEHKKLEELEEQSSKSMMTESEIKELEYLKERSEGRTEAPKELTKQKPLDQNQPCWSQILKLNADEQKRLKELKYRAGLELTKVKCLLLNRLTRLADAEIHQKWELLQILLKFTPRLSPNELKKLQMLQKPIEYLNNDQEKLLKKLQFRMKTAYLWSLVTLNSRDQRKLQELLLRVTDSLKDDDKKTLKALEERANLKSIHHEGTNELHSVHAETETTENQPNQPKDLTQSKGSPLTPGEKFQLKELQQRAKLLPLSENDLTLLDQLKGLAVEEVHKKYEQLHLRSKYDVIFDDRELQVETISDRVNSRSPDKLKQSEAWPLLNLQEKQLLRELQQRSEQVKLVDENRLALKRLEELQRKVKKGKLSPEKQQELESLRERQADIDEYLHVTKPKPLLPDEETLLMELQVLSDSTKVLNSAELKALHELQLAVRLTDAQKVELCKLQLRQKPKNDMISEVHEKWVNLEKLNKLKESSRRSTVVNEAKELKGQEDQSKLNWPSLNYREHMMLVQLQLRSRLKLTDQEKEELQKLEADKRKVESSSKQRKSSTVSGESLSLGLTPNEASGAKLFFDDQSSKRLKHLQQSDKLYPDLEPVEKKLLAELQQLFESEVQNKIEQIQNLSPAPNTQGRRDLNLQEVKQLPQLPSTVILNDWERKKLEELELRETEWKEMQKLEVGSELDIILPSGVMHEQRLPDVKRLKVTRQVKSELFPDEKRMLVSLLQLAKMELIKKSDALHCLLKLSGYEQKKHLNSWPVLNAREHARLEDLKKLEKIQILPDEQRQELDMLQDILLSEPELSPEDYRKLVKLQQESTKSNKLSNKDAVELEKLQSRAMSAQKLSPTEFKDLLVLREGRRKKKLSKLQFDTLLKLERLDRLEYEAIANSAEGNFKYEMEKHEGWKKCFDAVIEEEKASCPDWNRSCSPFVRAMQMSVSDHWNDIYLAHAYPFLYAQKLNYAFANHFWERFLLLYGKWALHIIVLIILSVSIVGGYRSLAQCHRFAPAGSNMGIFALQVKQHKAMKCF